MNQISVVVLRFCAIVIVLVSATAINAQTYVYDYQQFAGAVASEEPLIILMNPFQVNDHVTIEHDCTILPHRDITINLAGHFLQIASCSFTLGSSPYTISFINGAPNIRIDSTVCDVVGVITNCRFDQSQDFSGVEMRCGDFNLTLSFVSCTASYNAFDGFGLSNASETPGTAHVTLYDCEAIGNDPNGLGNPRGDGVTAHAVNHTFELIGGCYAENSKGGAAMARDSHLIVDGAVIENNGWATYIRDVNLDGFFGSLIWLDGYATTAWVSSPAHMYGGRIDDVHLFDIFAEFHMHGFGFDELPDGTISAFDSRWRTMSAGVDAYTPHLIPVPGDVNDDRMLGSLDAQAFMATGDDFCGDGLLLMAEACVLQLHLLVQY